MPKNIFTDTVTLNSGHSLILGHKPDKLSLAQITKKVETERQELESFGLFDNSTPNYSTYYPEVTSADLKPADSEFIYPVFRLLSETIVHKQWNPIDFSTNNALKSSMSKLVGQTINIDHETALGNAIGSVKEVSWQPGYKTANGIDVPGGINGVFKIDGKSNPRIARGVMMDPPSIHSNSVTVRFKWEKSHPKMEDSEFFDKLASFEKDGEMVRRIVTEVHSYHETSLVAHGADPWAQRIDSNDGGIINPDYANQVYNFSDSSSEAKQNRKSFFFDYKEDLTNLAHNSTTPDEFNNTTSDNPNSEQMKELLERLSTKFNFEAEEITEENFITHIEEQLNEVATLKSDKEALETEKTTLTEENVTLKSDKEALQTKVDELTPEAEIGKTSLEATRKETERLYNIIAGDAPDETLLKVIHDANFDTATSLLKQYAKQVEEKFTATCNDCGSNAITRATAAINEEGIVNNSGEEGTEENGKEDNDTFLGLRRNLQNKRKASAKRLHESASE